MFVFISELCFHTIFQCGSDTIAVFYIFVPTLSGVVVTHLRFILQVPSTFNFVRFTRPINGDGTLLIRPSKIKYCHTYFPHSITF